MVQSGQVFLIEDLDILKINQVLKCVSFFTIFFWEIGKVMAVMLELALTWRRASRDLKPGCYKIAKLLATSLPSTPEKYRERLGKNLTSVTIYGGSVEKVWG
mgnify:CR=1 FL=1